MANNTNMELHYGSAKHKRIQNAVYTRYMFGKNKRRDRTSKFTEAEDTFRMYVKETENDKLRKSAKESGVPAYVTIDVPYSYATMLSAHTYWATVFLGRDPILQYSARHGEPMNKVQAVEALMAYQVQVGRMLAPFYVWLHDTPKYGQGILWNYYAQEETTISEIITREKRYLGIPLPGTEERVKQTRRVKGYEGNKLFNVRPQDFVPDPRVSAADIQRGEFVGRETEVGWHELVNAQDGQYFNLDVVRQKQKVGSSFADREAGSTDVDLPWDNQNGLSATSSEYDIGDVGYVALIEMYIKIIPKDWHVGKGDKPEMWRFTLANRDVLIEARPMGNIHGKFPCFVLQYEIEGYATNPRGMLDILRPLNETMSWLVNTHFFNVRSSLNNQFVYDPSRLVTKDLTSPQAGKLIRMKEAAWGQDARTMIQQLPVADATQGHLRDSQIVAEMIQRVSGVTDNIMGMVNAGGRKTATEVRTSSTFGINRLKTAAEWWSAGDWGLLAQVMLQNTQQYYDVEQQFKVANGLTPNGQAPFMDVTPEAILGFYDFVPVDGTMPVDRFALVA